MKKKGAKAINDMIETIACMVENEEGWCPVFSDDPDRPTQVSHLDMFATLEVIARKIRSFKISSLKKKK